MATLMKCTQPHWQGNTFVPVGTVYPEGHSGAIAEFFEAFEVEVDVPVESKRRRGRPPGSKNKPAPDEAVEFDEGPESAPDEASAPEDVPEPEVDVPAPVEDDPAEP